MTHAKRTTNNLHTCISCTHDEREKPHSDVTLLINVIYKLLFFFFFKEETIIVFSIIIVAKSNSMRALSAIIYERRVIYDYRVLWNFYPLYERFSTRWRNAVNLWNLCVLRALFKCTVHHLYFLFWLLSSFIYIYIFFSSRAMNHCVYTRKDAFHSFIVYLKIKE